MNTMIRLPFLAALALFATIALSSNVDAFGGGGRRGGTAAGGSVATSSGAIVTQPGGPVMAPEPTTALATGLGLLAFGYLTRRFRD